MLALVVIGALILFLGGCGCRGYNNLVTGDNGVKKSWSDVETNYQRRADLYSTVVEAIEASAKFEKETFKEVIEARSKATQVQVNIDDAESLAKYQAAQGQLQGSFSRLLGVAEAYPALQTTKAFQDFQAQIEGTENRINIARKRYNEVVEKYNLSVRTFPSNIYASIFGFKEKAFYKADAGSEKVPKNLFNNK